MSSSQMWKVALCSMVLAFSVLFALPSFVPQGSVFSQYLPSKKVNLGLDLRGGASLLLEVDSRAYQKDLLHHYFSEIKNVLGKSRVSVGGARLDPITSTMTIQCGDSSIDSATKAVLSVLQDGAEIVRDQHGIIVKLSEKFLQLQMKQLLEQTMEIVRRRVDEKGTREIDLQRQGDSYILLQVPGMQDPSELKGILGKTAKLSFHIVVAAASDADALKPGLKVLPYDDGSGRLNQRVVVQSKPIISGEVLVDARVAVHEGSPIVNFKLNSTGARLFAEHSTHNIGRAFAIVMDGLVISAPVVREPILGGSGQISGNFSMASASELALLLRAGALPAPIKIVQERTIGPSLGADSIEAGARAIIMGGASVFILMLLVYYKLGIIANFALVVNIIMMLAILAIFDATLTLPGIAGIVLTLGMAVDANVLILERVREEISKGRTLPQAIRAGYDMAQTTIIDSNLTTVLAGVILYAFGYGPVRGFAVTLVIGILCSMFTAVTMTRLITELCLRRGVNFKVPI
jgi:preprotein translocase subunit SecD